jgi:hypothetical protein
VTFAQQRNQNQFDGWPLSDDDLLDITDDGLGKIMDFNHGSGFIPASVC